MTKRAIGVVGGALLGAVLPMMASATTVASGVADITGTFSFDFDTGVQGDFLTDPGQDVFWEQFTPTTRALVPENGAQIVNLGVVNFANLTLADLQGLSYGNAQISGSDGSNALVYGDVFAVKTNAGNYAKAIVAFPSFDASRDNGLPIYFETLAVPEPTAATLGLMGLGMLGLFARRQARLTLRLRDSGALGSQTEAEPAAPLRDTVVSGSIPIAHPANSPLRLVALAAFSSLESAESRGVG
ncbi:MAG TPA: hypothetical protein DEP35_09645 [Deltaproteobacteria bacterium]|nr:hypothetical protein [Deltaproteobacteria bacterium]